MQTKMRHVLGILFLSMLTMAAKSSPIVKRGQWHSHREVAHTKAYKSPLIQAPHINVKITPPELRGREAHVAVELYNFTATHLSVIDFIIIFENQVGDIVEAQITGENLDPKWSAIKWVKIPGDGRMAKVRDVRIKRMSMFDKAGKPVQFIYHTDLIKE